VLTCSDTQLCPTLCDPLDRSPPSSSVHGVSQTRILEWVTNFLLQEIFPTQDKGDFKTTLEKFNESLKIREEIGHKEGIAISLSKVGSIYRAKGDSKAAMEKFNESLKIGQEIGHTAGIATSLSNIGSIYRAKGDSKAAMEKFNESLKIVQEIGHKEGIATSFGNIGTIYQDKGDLKYALEKFNESLKIRQEIGDKNGISISYHNIGTLYKKKKDYLLSLQNLFKAVALRNQIEIKSQETLTYIFGIRKILGLAKFREFAEQAYDNLTEGLKPFLDLKEITKDTTIKHKTTTVGRNDPCPCGSGKKYKKCHGQI